MANASKQPGTSLAKRAGRVLRTVVGTASKALARAALAAETQPIYPPSPFLTWGYNDADEAVDDAVDDSELDAERDMRDAVTPIPDQAVFQNPRDRINPIIVNRAFFRGDHWQMGAGWIGPHPQITDPDYVTAMNELVQAFTSKNVVREVCRRHASGVIGKPASWSFVPRRTLKEGEKATPEEQTAIDRANTIVQRWMEAKKVRSLLHDATCTLLFSARAPLRLYIPAGLLMEDTSAGARPTSGRIVPTSIEQAIGMIYPDHPTPEHAAVVQDDDTKMEAGVRRYSCVVNDSDNATNTETQVNADNDAEEEQVELVFLDPQGRTVIRVLREDDEAADADEFTFDFGGRLTMMEMRRAPLVTPQVGQNQRALNLALSLIPRNVITGGFLERLLLNAQMPGHYEADADGVNTRRFMPDPITFGPNTANFLVGIETKDADGTSHLATPDVRYRDPIPIDASAAAAREHYLAILDEVSQLHVVLSGDAVVSGKSREQARKEYVNSLLDTKPEAEAALRFLLETPLAMAEALCGEVGALTNLVRIEVSARLDLGPLDATERAANEASVGKTLSQETAMALNGVDDVDAEKARMAMDPLARAQLALAQGLALVQWTTAGASIDTAAKAIGIDDAALAAKLAKDAEQGSFADPAGPGGTAKGGDSRSAGGDQSGKALPSGGKGKTQATKTTAPTGGAASQAGGDQ